MIEYLSPNFDERRDGATPQFIVLHGTWTKSIEDTLGFLTDPNPERDGGRVSCHYVIDKDGTIYQLVDEAKRAWHAGASFWRGIEDMNSASIGIEMQNSGMKNGMPEAYEDAQVVALSGLLQDIMARHGIPAENVIAHSDIAPARKDDPGEHFPWARLALCDVCVWPDENKVSADMVAQLLSSEDILMNALYGWGYDPRVTADLVVMAFDRHFVPEAFKNLGGVGVDDLRARRLAALWHSKLG